MAKKESTFINMTLTLAIVASVSALALGAVNYVTKESIEKAKSDKLKQAIGLVLPSFDSYEEINVAIDEKVKESILRRISEGGGGASLTFYKAIKDGKEVGTAVKSYTDKGFSGRFDIMVGFLPDGTIYNVMVLEHKETPGLGDKMEKSKSTWTDQFKNKNPEKSKLIVRKDGGDIDAITASTISSRAFCDAISRAYTAYTANKEEVK